MRKITEDINPQNFNRATYRADLLNKTKRRILPNLDIYQFGVYSGASMVSILDGFKELDIPYNKMWGLDSFCGIPKENNESLYVLEWGEGEFSCLDYLKVASPEVAARLIYLDILEYHKDANIEMIPSFYKDLKFNNKMLPASYIDIDCDIYTSTIEALEFMYKNNLIVKGTIINYDDWHSNGFGEGRAHVEFSEKYNISFRSISGEYKLFICEELCH